MASLCNNAKICIVTSAPVSKNPRVVKKVDALSEVGYEVVVVFVQHVLVGR